MNYKNVYSKFVVYFQTTNARQRLAKRNKNDERLQMSEIYTEIHHIMPKKLGGDDNSSNLVVLLPEEHIFIHKLRFKAFNSRVDMLAVRFCLNGYSGKGRIDDSLRLSKSVLSGYAWLRQNSSDFRKEHGWQTKEGRSRISEARKGTVVVKDCKTGEIIGSVSTKHPKYVDGTWVHHSKGKVLTEEQKLKKACHGAKNGRYSGVTDEQILQFSFSESLKVGRILSYPEIVRLAEKQGQKFPKSLSKFRFGGNGIKQIKKELEKMTGWEYKIYRSPEQREKLRLASSGQKRNKKDGTYVKNN